MRGPENDQPLPPLPPPAAACLARPQASSPALEPPGAVLDPLRAEPRRQGCSCVRLAAYLRAPHGSLQAFVESAAPSSALHGS